MDNVQTNETPKVSVLRVVLKLVIFVACLALTGLMLWNMMLSLMNQPEELAEEASAAEAVQLTLMDTYDSQIENVMAEAHEAALSVKKVFWINENAELPPVPDAAKYGQTDDPSSLQWLLDEAAELLDGQELTFSTDAEIIPGSKVTYYLDESILAITWKVDFFDFCYTLCEVKVNHPSQIRRYIAEDTYGARMLYEPTVMAANNNAVAAISGDYYRGRDFGIVVYDGVVYQASAGQHVDTCFVDENGDFHFTYRGDILDMETAQKFVDENNIDFSLAFGPILVDNGVQCEHERYSLGEVNDNYPRAAICQKDKLHYILVTANWDRYYDMSPTIHTFAEAVASLNVQKAYTLDGGKTGAIAMDGKLMNPTENLRQRRISDIVYFATAIPNWDTVETETNE